MRVRIYKSLVRSIIKKFLISEYHIKESQNFDMNLFSYYILMASGPLNNDGTIGHHTNATVSEESYNFRE